MHDSRNLLPAARVAAFGFLAAFILSLVTIWTGLIPESARLPLVTVSLLAFFASVACYLLVFGNRFAQPRDVERLVAGSTEPGLATFRSEAQYLIDAKASLGAGLGVWAGLISIIILGLLGSLISNTMAMVGAAVGVGLTLLALLLFLRSTVRAYRDREALWLRLGRQRWQFAAYLAASFALAGFAGLTRYVYHSKLVTGAAIVVVFLLLIRLRLLLQDLW